MLFRSWRVFVCAGQDEALDIGADPKVFGNNQVGLIGATQGRFIIGLYDVDGDLRKRITHTQTLRVQPCHCSVVTQVSKQHFLYFHAASDAVCGDYPTENVVI